MTKKHKEKLACPKCGRPIRVEIFDSINAQLNPKLAEKLYTGDYRSLFQARCPRCGFEASLRYPILFDDMDAGMMIQFDPDDEHKMQNVNAFAEKIDRIRADMEKQAHFKPTFRFRFVTSLRDLSEKARIFRDGYDDRLIELVKLILRFKLLENNPDLEIMGLYYTRRDRDTFVFSGSTEEGQGIEAEILVETYRVAEDLLETSALDDKDPLIVDPNFALQILNTQS